MKHMPCLIFVGGVGFQMLGRNCWPEAALVVILEEFFFGPFLVSAGFALLARALEVCVN